MKVHEDSFHLMCFPFHRQTPHVFHSRFRLDRTFEVDISTFHDLSPQAAVSCFTPWERSMPPKKGGKIIHKIWEWMGMESHESKVQKSCTWNVLRVAKKATKDAQYMIRSGWNNHWIIEDYKCSKMGRASWSVHILNILSPQNNPKWFLVPQKHQSMRTTWRWWLRYQTRPVLSVLCALLQRWDAHWCHRNQTKRGLHGQLGIPEYNKSHGSIPPFSFNESGNFEGNGTEMMFFAADDLLFTYCWWCFLCFKITQGNIFSGFTDNQLIPGSLNSVAAWCQCTTWKLMQFCWDHCREILV